MVSIHALFSERLDHIGYNEYIKKLVQYSGVSDTLDQ